jgi:anti-sigma factor RsiW
MNESENDRLLRMVEGSLPADEEEEMRRRLAGSPELRREFDELQRLRWIMRAGVEETAGRSLRPLFSDRVMARLSAEDTTLATASPIDEMVEFLTRLFRPVLAVGLLFAVALALYNVNIASAYSEPGTITESVLGLPAVSSTAVYDLDLYSNNFASEQ